MHADPKLTELTAHKRRLLVGALDALFAQIDLTESQHEIVQMLKRHRDVSFAGRGRAEIAPISVILTTLAARSYAYCTTRFVYADAYELIVDVVRRMPEFIVVEYRNGSPFYFIENETTACETFADKWNLDPSLPRAFYGWHKDVIALLELLVGLHRPEDRKDERDDNESENG